MFNVLSTVNKTQAIYIFQTLFYLKYNKNGQMNITSMICE